MSVQMDPASPPTLFMDQVQRVRKTITSLFPTTICLIGEAQLLPATWQQFIFQQEIPTGQFQATACMLQVL